MVGLLNINTTDPDRTNYIIMFLLGNTMIATKEFFKSRNVPEIGKLQFTQRIISTNQIISHKKKLRISYFQKYYHLYNRN